MAKTKKNKKTYKELIDELSLLESLVVYYRDYLEHLGVLLENYIEMNGDTEKIVKYISEKGEKIENRWNEKT